MTQVELPCMRWGGPTRSMEIGLAVVWAVVGLVAGLPGALAAQTETEPSAEIVDLACRACDVDLELLAVLGDVSGEGMLEAELNSVRVDAQSRFVVTDGDSPFLWVFRSDGSFVHRVGRRGEGPGEFRWTSAILVGPSDSVFVFDPSLRRLTVYDSEHELGRTAPLEIAASFDATFVDDGIVVNADVRSPERAGLPLHLLDPGGEILTSFGSVTARFRPDLGYGVRRAVAASGRTAVWSAWLNRYRMERWGTDGTLLQVLERDVDWFEPYEEPAGGPEEPPSPLVRALHEEAGVLWVLLTVPSPQWREAIDTVIPGPEGQRGFIRIGDRNAYQHTVIEAIDLQTGTVTRSMRIPRLIWGFAGPGPVVFGPDMDPAGNPLVRVWRVEPGDGG